MNVEATRKTLVAMRDYIARNGFSSDLGDAGAYGDTPPECPRCFLGAMWASAPLEYHLRREAQFHLRKFVPSQFPEAHFASASLRREGIDTAQAIGILDVAIAALPDPERRTSAVHDVWKRRESKVPA